jgi:carboxylesterase
VEDHIHYDRYPTRAVQELASLLDEMRGILPTIKVPALLMHSKKDQGVTFENMAEIYNGLGSQDKTTVTLENSGHVITRDMERNRVFRAAGDFIRRVCPES